MKVLLITSILALGQALQLSELYPISSVGRVRNGDSESSPAIELKVPIVFYGRVYESISIHTDGFVTFNHPDVEEALLAPYMSDLDSSGQGSVRYKEHQERNILRRAARDIRRVFQHEAKKFHPKSVFIVTWEDISIHNADNDATFTFQCVLASDGKETYAMLLYPQDAMGKGDLVTPKIYNSFAARAGYHDEGREYLDQFELTKLVSQSNNGKNGEWVFKIGKRRSKHATKVEKAADISEVFKRQSGFSASSVDIFGEEVSDVCTLSCTEDSTCKNFAGEKECCVCNNDMFGNGYFCLPNDKPVRYNGNVKADYATVDQGVTTINVTAAVSHAYVHTQRGRAHFAISGLSETLQISVQPVIDFCTILGWLFSTADYPAVNGMDITDGRINARTILQSDDFYFIVDQSFTNSSFDPESDSSVISGETRFYGTLPKLGKYDVITFENFVQVFTIEDKEINSEATRRYSVNGTQKEYSVTQYIQYDTCHSDILSSVPKKIALNVSQIYVESTSNAIENLVRFAMDMHASPSDGVVIPKPEIPTPAPFVPVPDEPSNDEIVDEEEEDLPPVIATTRTECEKQLESARQQMEADPEAKIQFPTCMPLGTFAPRQCSQLEAVRCWCVDQDTGTEIDGTMKEGDTAYELDCSDVKADETLTDCQKDRKTAEEEARGNDGASVFMPLCTAAGAYEPLQQHPDQYYMCFNFFGEETRRSYERPDCLEPCEKNRYYTETNNIFLNTNEFVPKCNNDGSYQPKQCEETACYCVNSNGVEIENSRAEITSNLNCDPVPAPPQHETFTIPAPVVPESTDGPAADVLDEEDVFEEETVIEEEDDNELPTVIPPPAQSDKKLVFAQSMGINTLNLPLGDEIRPKRAYQKAKHIFVGLAYDCMNEDYYYSDLYSRSIMTTKLTPQSIPTSVVSSGIRSPEGLAVDYLSGLIYWTDSGSDTIEVAKLDGSHRLTIVSEGLVNPRGIAVDPHGGRIYWTDWNRKAPKIMVANGDGSNARALVTEGLQLPNGIAFDAFARKVCFIDAGTKKIECVKPDGTSREAVFYLTNATTQKPYSLAIDGDNIYYSNWGQQTSKPIHAINVRTGEDIAFSGPLGAHGNVYGMVVTSQCRGGYNFCVENNGGCSGICLPTPTGPVCK